MGAADDAVKGAVEQLNKARAEVLAQDASQEANAVSPETLQSLKDAAQSFDDLNPDAPAGGGEVSPGDVGTGGDTSAGTETPSGNPDGPQVVPAPPTPEGEPGPDSEQRENAATSLDQPSDNTGAE